MDNGKGLKLFSLNSNRPLAEKIAKEVGVELCEVTVNKFSDGEIQVNIEESIRGAEVFVIQSISDPINDSLMELLIMIDALRRASAEKINVVIPYYGYSRQDRKAKSREPITAKLVANLLEMDNIDRVLTLQLHSPQIQGFFDIPVDNLTSAPLLASYFTDNNFNKDEIVVISPDHSSISKARSVAKILGSSLAIIDNRDESNGDHDYQFKNKKVEIIGDVKNKIAIIIDDLIDTGYRLVSASEVLKEEGARQIYGCATHAILSSNSYELIESSSLKKVIVTDSIFINKFKMIDKLEVLSVGPLIGNAIYSIHNNEQLAPLFRSKI